MVLAVHEPERGSNYQLGRVPLQTYFIAQFQKHNISSPIINIVAITLYVISRTFWLCKNI